MPTVGCVEPLGSCNKLWVLHVTARHQMLLCRGDIAVMADCRLLCRRNIAVMADCRLCRRDIAVMADCRLYLWGSER